MDPGPVAVIRFGKDGVYRVRPPGGLVAARFRHYEARSGMPLLHDHLIFSQRPPGDHRISESPAPPTTPWKQRPNGVRPADVHADIGAYVREFRLA